MIRLGPEPNRTGVLIGRGRDIRDVHAQEKATRGHDVKVAVRKPRSGLRGNQRC